MRLSHLLVLAGLSMLTACQRTSVTEAQQLVEHYNRVVAEAYRRGDAKLVDPVVGPHEGKKLTGLIGVRLDFGLTLDSTLLSLQIKDVKETADELRVFTRESWSYRDLKIGSGEQVGEASRDSYEMLYVFRRINRTWMVDEIRYTSAPQIGRKTPTWQDHQASPRGLAEGTTP